MTEVLGCTLYTYKTITTNLKLDQRKTIKKKIFLELIHKDLSRKIFRDIYTLDIKLLNIEFCFSNILPNEEAVCIDIFNFLLQ